MQILIFAKTGSVLKGCPEIWKKIFSEKITASMQFKFILNIIYFEEADP